MGIASKIDHTLLKADCREEDISQLCAEAINYGFYSVCVPPSYVKFASGLVSGTNVKVCTVIGFPLGYQTKATKIYEAAEAIDSGALEIDMVMNISAFKSGNIDLARDISEICELVQGKGAVLKVIIETAYLNQDEIVRICEMLAKTKVDYVKTSTGFAGKGATVEDIALMRKILPGQIKIKASGGIKNQETAMKMIEAGADRLGTSSGLSILNINQVERNTSQY